MLRVEPLSAMPDIRASSRSMMISDVARLHGLTPRAIRFYEEQGLIRSSRTSQGYRLYDRPSLDRLAFIVEARQIGVSVRALRGLVRSGAIDDPALRRRAILDACSKCLDDLERKLALVEATMVRQP